MKLIETGMADLFIIEPKVFGDERGYFFESYNHEQFKKNGLNYNFIQDNESFSKLGTLRGLHFQKGEFAQAKLVRAVSGSILDVVVDLRPNSKTFGKKLEIELNEVNKRSVIVPRGFAHGFIVLSETALFAYKCDNIYNPSAEGGIAYNDKDLKIDWRVPSDKMILSEKDQRNESFVNFRESL